MKEETTQTDHIHSMKTPVVCKDLLIFSSNKLPRALGDTQLLIWSMYKQKERHLQRGWKWYLRARHLAIQLATQEAAVEVLVP